MQIGLYLHVPFCQSKCAYCDFASVAGRSDLFERYGQAIIRELRHAADPAHYNLTAGWSVETVYIGGGTPSVLPLSMVRQILAAVQDAYGVSHWERHSRVSGTPASPAVHPHPRPFSLTGRRGSHMTTGGSNPKHTHTYEAASEIEITVEINPGTVDRAYLDGLRPAGVNRLSIGVQSFDDAELRLLGRIHDRRRALETLADARAAGFERLSLDLIFGLPSQTMSNWQRSLDGALECRPEHMSLYALSLEEGTPLAGQVACGALPAPDGDLAAEMYEMAGATLAAAGYEQYEISNWSLPGEESRHNLHTWRNGSYLGFGPAAHSHLGRRRWWNVANPETYIAQVEAGRSPRAGEEELDAATDMAETMILELRLVRDGVEIEAFRRRYGQTPADLYGPILDDLVEWGLIEVTPARIRLSPRGRLLGNQVFARFLPEQG